MAELVPQLVERFGLLDNVWLGVSTENQNMANERIPHLCATPAVIRFLSVEPLLGPVDLFRDGTTLAIGWIIVGGESGSNARPLELRWLYSLIEQCQAAKIPVFIKQLGVIWARAARAKSRKGGDPDEWEPGLRIRELPEGQNATRNYSL